MRLCSKADRAPYAKPIGPEDHLPKMVMCKSIGQTFITCCICPLSSNEDHTYRMKNV